MSYFERNLGEPILLHIFLLGDFFSQQLILNEITVRNKVPTRIFPLGTPFPSVISRGTMFY
jgi:hypothetical protein